jgi:NADH:ubiquinone oxidoreductase subunit 6 (subunit J)
MLNQLKNLVYRIFNLINLSLLIIGLWSYSTDFIFIYIVYILAFIGAVLMLFLSVVLMLPSSVISNTNISKFNLLLICYESQGNYYYYNFLCFLVLLLALNYVIVPIVLDFQTFNFKKYYAEHMEGLSSILFLKSF